MKGKSPIIFAALAVIVLAAVDAIFKDDLLEVGSDVTQAVQEAESLTVDILAFGFGLVNQWAMLFLASCVAYEKYPRLGLELVTLLSGSGILAVFLKVLYADPRPFWYDDQVDGLACDRGFGNPSSHAVAAGLGLFVFAHIIVKNRHWKYWLCSLGLLLVAVSRVYVGVHFVSQVVLGAGIGILIFIAYIHSRQSAKETVSYLTTSNGIVMAHVGSVAAVVSVWALGLIRAPYWKDEYSSNIDQQCDQSVDQSDQLHTHVVQAAMVFLVPGSLLGHRYSLDSLGGWWRGQRTAHRVYRLLLVLGLLAAVYETRNNYAELVLGWYTPYYALAIATAVLLHFTGVSVFYLLPLIADKFGWNNPNAQQESGELTDVPSENAPFEEDPLLPQQQYVRSLYG